VNDQLLHVLLFVVPLIFSAGGFYVYARLSIVQLRKDAKQSHQELKKDINGLGAKIARIEYQTDTRHHNASLAIMVAVPVEREAEITKLLKEG